MNTSVTSLLTGGLISLASVIGLQSCTSNAQNKPINNPIEKHAAPANSTAAQSNKKYYVVEGNTVRIKPIQLYFEFTDALHNAIVDNNEEFEVVFEIVPNTERELPKFIEELMDEKGSATLYEETIEGLNYQRAHLLKDIVLDKKVFEAFQAEELYININIYSSRKHFELNIISATDDASTVEHAVNNDVTIKASLL